MVIGMLPAAHKGEEALAKEDGGLVGGLGWVAGVGEESASGVGPAQLVVQFAQGQKADVAGHVAAEKQWSCVGDVCGRNRSVECHSAPS